MGDWPPTQLSTYDSEIWGMLSEPLDVPEAQDANCYFLSGWCDWLWPGFDIRRRQGLFLFDTGPDWLWNAPSLRSGGSVSGVKWTDRESDQSHASKGKECVGLCHQCSIRLHGRDLVFEHRDFYLLLYFEWSVADDVNSVNHSRGFGRDWHLYVEFYQDYVKCKHNTQYYLMACCVP
jgi:hypothetical protein